MGFTAEYDYRVFELLPVLRRLDEDEANKVLKGSQQAQLQLKQFPNGIQSLNPNISDTPLKEESGQFLGGWSIGDQEEMKVHDMNNARVQEISRTAKTNPRQAMAAAATLPDSIGPFWRAECPRAQAYLAIARSAMKKNPSSATDALEEMASFSEARTSSLSRDGQLD